jgi:hypothetical protein
MSQGPLNNEVIEFLQTDNIFSIRSEVDVPLGTLAVHFQDLEFKEHWKYVESVDQFPPLVEPKAGLHKMIVIGKGHPQIKIGEKLPFWSA